MTYKQTRKYFLAAISFLAFGILFSCKNQNKNDVPDEKKEEFVITFGASPENEGSVVATLDGNPIKSGVTKVSKGKEVVFTLTISNSNAYELEDWDGGAVKDSSNPLMAKLTVSSNATVIAKLKTKKPDPELTLASLKLYKTDINISNLSDIKIEVDNLVPILRSTDVDAEFTYGEQTTPKRIDVNVDKGKLNIGLNTIKLSVQAVPGEYKYWEQEIKITRKEGDTPSVAIPAEARLESIEVAIVAEKKGKAKVEEFKPLEGFNGEESGPYAMEEAKTAYIELNVKVAKPSSGEFTIQAVNKTTYIAPVAFSRKSGDQEGYFKKNRIVLSKGLNVIEVKVKSPDGSKEGIYTIVVQYGGGPDPNTLEMKDRNIIPGIYCPTQRKHLDGEKPDYVLLIAIAGWCGYCPRPLGVAGSSGKNVANKYKDKGLRVIAVDRDATAQDESVKKWKVSGANYPLYTKDNNSFASFYRNISGYPTCHLIKDWKIVATYNAELNESHVKEAFDF